MSAQLELSYPRLLKATYLIHETGGYHPFKDVEEAAPIFKQNCWPYIQRIHWPNQTDRANEWRKTRRPQQMNLNMSFQHAYPYLTLMGTKKVLKQAKNKSPCWSHEAVYMKMHSAVGRAFVPNLYNKPHLCHVNDDPADYRVVNLKWGTNKENHTGRRNDRKMSFSTLHTIFKLNGWAKG